MSEGACLLARDPHRTVLADEIEGGLLAPRQVAVGRRGLEQGFQWGFLPEG